MAVSAKKQAAPITPHTVVAPPSTVESGQELAPLAGPSSERGIDERDAQTSEVTHFLELGGDLRQAELRT